MSNVLAEIIAGEAATALGQQAVLNVIMNRAAQDWGGYGKTWIAQATAPLQFSAYPNALGKPTSYTLELVQAAIDGTLGNIVPLAVNYANPTIGATAKVSWVAEAVAKGMGVNVGGEGNVFWGPNGSSPGYDPSKAFRPGMSPAPPPVAVVTPPPLVIPPTVGAFTMDPALMNALAQFAPVIESFVAGIFRGAGTALAPALPAIVSQLTGANVTTAVSPLPAIDLNALAASLAPLINAQIQTELPTLISAALAKLTPAK